MTLWGPRAGVAAAARADPPGLDDVTPHTLRHSFASIAVAGGNTLPIIGALLGHSRPETTARYAHLSRDPLKKATDAIAEKIESSLGRKAAA